VLSGIEKKLSGAKIRGATAHLASETNFAVENVIPIQTSGETVKLFHGVGKTRVRKLHFAPPAGFDLSKLPIRGERKFQIVDALKEKYQQAEKLFAQEAAAAQPGVSAEAGIPKVVNAVPKPQVTLEAPNTAFKQEKKTAADQKIQVTAKPTSTQTGAVSSAQMVPLTNKPNVLSGLVVDSVGNPVVDAILTVRDSMGIPLRALKTNKLGQFLSATPLANGQYVIEVDSQTGEFRPISILGDGKVITPFEIHGERGVN
jgi:hypothetical protein